MSAVLLGVMLLGGAAEPGDNQPSAPEKRAARGQDEHEAFPREESGEELLCNRATLADPSDMDGARRHGEDADQTRRSVYIFSGITVAQGGWHINRMTVFFGRARNPDCWAKLTSGRLNVFPKTARLPAPFVDPTSGRVVPVSVKRQGKIYAVVASGLDIKLGPAHLLRSGFI